MHLKRVNFHPDKYPTREHHPFNLDLLHQTGVLNFETPVTLFVGENGTGKSTLLEAITHRCGIYIWRNQRRRFKPNPYENMLRDCISIEWTNGQVPGSFFGSSIFSHFTQILDEWASMDPGVLKYFGGESLVAKSHGQSIMSFFKARYAIKGLYLLDEPETALSPKTQLKLLELLSETSSTGKAQFIIATHSPILLSCPGAVIYSFDHSPVKRLSYADTDHYKVYKAFMKKSKSVKTENKNG
ncbi:AAA family ATPase [Thermodesulfobacteriota bacterium]